jgi:3-oxoacyl-[acyl-carrier protein] reductase
MNIVIAGASRGIGGSLASHWASQGHAVTGLARSSPDDWSVDDRVNRVRCDLSNESEVRQAFSSLRSGQGTPWLVVHVAGIFSAELMITTPAARVKDVLNANVITAHNVFRESAKAMARSGGRVVATSSIAAGVMLTGNGLYATSKVALEALTKAYAVELKGTKCTFNAVRVSFAEGSGMLDTLQEGARDKYNQRLLNPDFLGVQVLADVIALLASDSGAWINGQTITLGGLV